MIKNRFPCKREKPCIELVFWLHYFPVRSNTQESFVGGSMNLRSLFHLGISVTTLFLLSHCAGNKRTPATFPIQVVTTSSSVTTTTLGPCSSQPGVIASTSAVVNVNVNVPASITFSGSALCGYEFKIISGQRNMTGQFISAGGQLQIFDVFDLVGTQMRTYTYQLVTAQGVLLPGVYSTTLTLTVNNSATTTTVPITTTTTTTILMPMPLSLPVTTCQIERVIDSAHPPTSNSQRKIWVRVNVLGLSIASMTLNGVSVNPSYVHQIEDNQFPFFEMEARVTDAVGQLAICRLSVAVPSCTQSVVGQVNPTSVSTAVTVTGRYDRIYIQNVLQPNPSRTFPTVTYTETFASATANLSRTTLGRVDTFVGDTWSCPVTYTVPAYVPPRPPSYLNLGEGLSANQMLVPEGPNVCNCRAVMQGDGNFVVYGGNTALWNTHTWNNPNSQFWLQSDSNMVVYSSAGKAKWSSSTCNRGAWRLYMQADCNLVLYSDNFVKVLWQSHTHRSSCY
jgi:hypothetical protein